MPRHSRVFTFVHMENNDRHDEVTPSECFKMEEVKLLQSIENQNLIGVQYFVWLSRSTSDAPASIRFLWTLELSWADGGTLLLSAGEDSDALQVISPAALVDTVNKINTLHGQSVIQRMVRTEFQPWTAFVGQRLSAIRLTPHESGAYLNDALLLDFGSNGGIVVSLSPEQEGLIIIPA